MLLMKSEIIRLQFQKFAYLFVRKKIFLQILRKSLLMKSNI